MTSSKLALISCVAVPAVLPFDASAEVVNLNGVRITSVPSLAGSCGMDLV